MSPLKQAIFLCYEYSIRFCLWINRKSKNKTYKLILYLCCSPYLVLHAVFQIMREKIFSEKFMRIQLKKEKKKSFKYKLGIVAIAKNESAHIREWVAYHLAMGADIIYLYDNGSDDNTKGQVQDYITQGKVIYIYFPGKNKQLPAYDHAISNYKNICKYIAFIDCDEFLVVPSNKKLVDVIDNIISNTPNAGGLGVNWALYGSSGYEKKQPGLLIETYLKRGENKAWPNFHVKTIVNPRLVKCYISPHFPIYKLGVWSVDGKGHRQRLWYNHDVDFSIIRCNHYFCKSKEEFISKRSRGMADRQEKYDMSKFNEYDLNDVEDTIMLQYVQITKELMKQ